MNNVEPFVVSDAIGSSRQDAIIPVLPQHCKPAQVPHDAGQRGTLAIRNDQRRRQAVH